MDLDLDKKPTCVVLVPSTPWLVVGFSDGQAEIFDLAKDAECIIICTPMEGVAGMNAENSGERSGVSTMMLLHVLNNTLAKRRKESISHQQRQNVETHTASVRYLSCKIF